MRIMSLVEQLFFLLEKKKQPMHVGGLFLFELPANADEEFVSSIVQNMLDNKVAAVFPFNQVVHNFTFWKPQENAKIKDHLHYIHLSKVSKGWSVNELIEYISSIHALPLDKSRPLWECYIIDGVAPINASSTHRFAMYFKIHHSILDGVAAMRLVQESLSSSPYEIMNFPPWTLINRKADSEYTITPPDRSASKVISEQVKTLKPVFNELKKSFASRKNHNHVSVTQTPPSILNQRITESRKITIHSSPLSRFERIAVKLNASINDIALTICSGALRNYLLALNNLPDKPLIAAVPISLRNDSSATGNQVSLVLCNLGTHIEKPIDRLNTIKNSIKVGKDRFHRMTQAEVINYSGLSYAWEGINLITNAYPRKQAFNILISNVQGPKEPLFWNGAKLTSLHPASVLLHGQALNITLVSYLDRIDFGIVACPQVLCDTEQFPDLINKELTVLEKLCL